LSEKLAPCPEMIHFELGIINLVIKHYVANSNYVCSKVLFLSYCYALLELQNVELLQILFEMLWFVDIYMSTRAKPGQDARLNKDSRFECQNSLLFPLLVLYCFCLS